MLTVTAQNLLTPEEAAHQGNLFASGENQKRKKLQRLEQTVDQIRNRYGKSAIQLAALTEDRSAGTEIPDHISFKDH